MRKEHGGGLRTNPQPNARRLRSLLPSVPPLPPAPPSTAPATGDNGMRLGHYCILLGPGGVHAAARANRGVPAHAAWCGLGRGAAHLRMPRCQTWRGMQPSRTGRGTPVWRREGRRSRLGKEDRRGGKGLEGGGGEKVWRRSPVSERLWSGDGVRRQKAEAAGGP